MLQYVHNWLPSLLTMACFVHVKSESLSIAGRPPSSDVPEVRYR